jgi:hypothetical protein
LLMVDCFSKAFSGSHRAFSPRAMIEQPVRLRK